MSIFLKQDTSVQRLDRPAQNRRAGDIAAPTVQATAEELRNSSNRKLGHHTRPGTQKVLRRELQTLSQRNQERIQQNSVQVQQKGTLVGILSTITSRVASALKVGVSRISGREAVSDLTKDDFTALEGKSIEAQMAERGPDKRQLAKAAVVQRQANQLALRASLQTHKVYAPEGYLDALQEELDEENFGEGSETEYLLKKSKKLERLPLEARLNVTHGRVLAKSSILLRILPKAVERWLELVNEGKPAGPTLREMKQLSQFSRE